MKTNIFKSVSLFAVVIAMISFTANPIKKKTLNTKESKIEWEGEKLTGSHEGTIMFKEGYLDMDGDKITGGEFIVDMTSIVATDLEGEGKQKLEGHLKSDDFFGVANHPTAKLTIKNECIKTQLEIEKLHKLQISNSNIVKELQSNKEFLMSEEYISSYLLNEMTVAVPETLLIEIR